MAAEAKRRLRLALVGSALAHVVVVILLGLRPAPPPIVFPPAITVDLVARPPSVAPAPAAAKPAPAPSKPAPKPEPAKSVPAPPPPPPKQAKLLPKQAQDAPARAAPAPAAVERRPRPKEMELGDAMAALRSELGESSPVPSTTADAAPETAAAEQAESSDVESSSGGSMAVSPEMLAWLAATRRHVQERWVNPPEFLNRGYVTELEVELRADGSLVGPPEVRRSSGDPYADDNAVRALQKASPLPPPPAAGRQIFIFVPEARP